jgi:hypothetical protein
MNALVNKYEHQLDQALVLAEKLNKEKSYLIDLLIKDTSSSTTAIINKYLDWLEENER